MTTKNASAESPKFKNRREMDLWQARQIAKNITAQEGAAKPPKKVKAEPKAKK